MNLIDIYNGWKNMIGFENLPPERKAVIENRMRTCGMCPHLSYKSSLLKKVMSVLENLKKPAPEQEQTSGSYCNKLSCGCNMNALLTLPESKCPDNPPRWQ